LFFFFVLRNISRLVLGAAATIGSWFKQFLVQQRRLVLGAAALNG